MTERALSFGSVAAAYERFRPGYPAELVDEVVSYADRPLRTALEIGAGTGKATRAFAARGIDVTATDPDPNMLAELRKHVPASVTTLQASFEELAVPAHYDLVFAAASLHWTTPDQRWTRVAAMITRRGVFASFGAQRDLSDPDLEQAARAVRSPFLEDDDIASPDGTRPDSPMQWPGTELEQSDLFTDVRQSTIEQRTSMSADDYIGHLSTVSAYLQLSEQARRVVLERIAAVLPDQVMVTADINLHLARVR